MPRCNIKLVNVSWRMCFRKRVRNNNCEEECCDFMPLSKRINNLHINNGNFCTSLGYQHLKHSVTKQVLILEEWQAYFLPSRIKVKDTVLEKATWKHRMYVSSLFSFLTWNTFSLFLYSVFTSYARCVGTLMLLQYVQRHQFISCCIVHHQGRMDFGHHINLHVL